MKRHAALRPVSRRCRGTGSERLEPHFSKEPRGLLLVAEIILRSCQRQTFPRSRHRNEAVSTFFLHFETKGALLRALI